MLHDKKIILLSGKLPLQYKAITKEMIILDDETSIKIHSKVNQHSSIIMMGTIPNPQDLEGKTQAIDLLSEYQHNTSIPNTRIIPISLSSIPTISEDIWISYSDTCLWPLFHYKLWDGLRISEDNLTLMDQLNNYKAVNEVFAESISPIIVEENDEIWILDHHLLLLPQMLRDRFPSLSITTYHKGPWPSSEFFKCLPGASLVLEGMLGSSQIGMQTMNYIRHFISSSQRILGCESFENEMIENIITGLPTFLIKAPLLGRGKKYLLSDAIRTKSIQDKYLLPSKMMILVIEEGSSRDLLKLQAIKEILKEEGSGSGSSGSGSGKIYFIYTILDICQDKTNLILNEISKINSQFGSLEYTPIQLQIQPQIMDPIDWLSLLSSCHILLVTGDIGLHERVFDICSLNSRCKAFIVNEFVEVDYPLASSMIYKVNPYNENEIRTNLSNLIKRQRKMMEDNEKNIPFIPPLEESFNPLFERIQGSKQMMISLIERPILSLDKILVAYETTKGKRLFLLDYDGTLSPLYRRPEDARPSEELLRIIRMLTMDPKNMVYIISGRDQKTLDEWFGRIKRLGLSAEHGSFLKAPVDVGDSSGWINLINDCSFDWKADIEEIMEYYIERCPGSTIEHKKTSLVWHYRATDPDFGSWLAKEMVNHVEKMAMNGVEVMQGKKNVEVKSTTCNKGQLVKRIIERFGDDSSFLMCAGDDRTDEDMFKMLEDIQVGKDCDTFTCKVGGDISKHSNSKFFLSSPAKMVSLLMRLTSLVAERSMMTL